MEMGPGQMSGGLMLQPGDKAGQQPRAAEARRDDEEGRAQGLGVGATPPAQMCAAQGNPALGPPTTATSLETTPMLRPGAERRGTLLFSLLLFRGSENQGILAPKKLSSLDS